MQEQTSGQENHLESVSTGKTNISVNLWEMRGILTFKSC